MHNREQESELVLSKIAKWNNKNINTKFEIDIEHSTIKTTEDINTNLIGNNRKLDSLKLILTKPYVKYTLLFTGVRHI